MLKKLTAVCLALMLAMAMMVWNGMLAEEPADGITIVYYQVKDRATNQTAQLAAEMIKARYPERFVGAMQGKSKTSVETDMKNVFSTANNDPQKMELPGDAALQPETWVILPATTAANAGADGSAYSVLDTHLTNDPQAKVHFLVLCDQPVEMGGLISALQEAYPDRVEVSQMYKNYDTDRSDDPALETFMWFAARLWGTPGDVAVSPDGSFELQKGVKTVVIARQKGKNTDVTVPGYGAQLTASSIVGNGDNAYGFTAVDLGFLSNGPYTVQAQGAQALGVFCYPDGAENMQASIKLDGAGENWERGEHTVVVRMDDPFDRIAAYQVNFAYKYRTAGHAEGDWTTENAANYQLLGYDAAEGGWVYRVNATDAAWEAVRFEAAVTLFAEDGNLIGRWEAQPVERVIGTAQAGFIPDWYGKHLPVYYDEGAPGKKEIGWKDIFTFNSADIAEYLLGNGGNGVSVSATENGFTVTVTDGTEPVALKPAIKMVDGNRIET